MSAISNNKNVVISNDDRLKMNLLVKRMKTLQGRLHIYKGKNKTKRRRYLFKKSKIDSIKNEINLILYPYAEEIFNTQLTNETATMFANFADVNDFSVGKAYIFDIPEIDDFGISKKYL